MKLRHGYFAALLALAYVAILWMSAPAVGFTRDEGYYFKAAQEYAGWWDVLFSSNFFDAFKDQTIRKYFEYNHEHPPLVKLSQGITYIVFSEWLGVATPSQGFRIAGFVFGGLSVWWTYRLGRELFNPQVGLLGAALLVTIPRYFYDAHLACFDIAITAMWTGSLMAYVPALTAPPERRWRTAIWAAFFWGLALSTKLNAFFLPFLFVTLWFVAPPTPLSFRRNVSPSGGRDLIIPRIPFVLVLSAIVGPLVLVASWPWLWHDTLVRFGNYLGFHLHHEHYPAMFFGQLLVEPPFPISFPIWMSVLTLPSPIIFLGALGLLRALWRALGRRSLADATVLLSTVVPIALIAMPNTPIFGGVKHWFNAMPTLCLLAAVVALQAVYWLPKFQRAGLVIVTLLMLMPGVLGMARSHPNGIGYYNELAGGFRGGAELKMQRAFWGGLVGPLVPEFGELAGGRGSVFFNRTNYDAYRMYRREGTLQKGLGFANKAKGAKLGVHFEQPEHAEEEGNIWSSLGTRPLRGIYQGEVTLIQVYGRKASQKPPEANKTLPPE